MGKAGARPSEQDVDKALKDLKKLIEVYDATWKAIWEYSSELTHLSVKIEEEQWRKSL